MDAAKRKHGLKSATKKTALLAAAEEEADETLDFLDSRAQLGEERVRGADLSVKLKYRQDKEERLASVLEGAPKALGLCPRALDFAVPCYFRPHRGFEPCALPLCFA